MIRCMVKRAIHIWSSGFLRSPPHETTMAPTYESLSAYRQSISHAKHKAIVSAAFEVFLSHGYERASVASIAKAAGVSSVTLYKHFPSKAELFGQVMAAVWDEESIDARPPMDTAAPGQVLRRLGVEYVALLQRPATRPLFRTIVAEVERAPELGLQLYEKAKRPYLQRVEGYVAQCVQAGSLTTKDVALATRQLLGMINDVVFWPTLLIKDLEVTPAEAERVVDEAVQTFMARYGVRSPRGRKR